MNELLGEPVPVFQLPGRGILMSFINEVVIRNTLIVLMVKRKTTGDAGVDILRKELNFV